MSELIAVGVGGFIGSCLRFAFTRISNYFGFSFPYGTLVSNVIASILIGFIIGLEQDFTIFPPKVKLFLTTGLLGGLSTFSTFSLETVNYFQAGKQIAAIGNIGLNIGLSLLGVIGGMGLARLLAKWI